MKGLIVFPGKDLIEAAGNLAPRERGLVLWTLMETELPEWLPEDYAMTYARQLIISTGEGLHKYHDEVFSRPAASKLPWWANNNLMVENHRGYIYQYNPSFYRKRFRDLGNPGKMRQLLPSTTPGIWRVDDMSLQEDPDLFYMIKLLPPPNTLLNDLQAWV